MNPITKSRARNSLIILLSILIVDQVSKILVKTNMTLHESIEIFSWFKIMFIENNGMAYGMELGSKLLLSLMRFVLIAILVQYVLRELRNNSRWGYIVCLVMIVAGAVGNMIDGMFYGVVFDASTPYTVSTFVEPGDGYSSFLYGKVVDMLYFPIIDTVLPDWVPFYGGEPYVFFSPVFNIADSSISVAVALLLLFYRKECSELSLSRIFGIEDRENKEEKKEQK
ncbi:lipoprotein signal peptidase [Prevotella sp. P2-180]|uniref:lipoprotein signal peptidase n=1 Tax=Prevotella sp. P2-180 TaxID=2024224 RepID=UPI000B96B906|nr:lipoprotein signal peptidase [Prevotella sp. P2-180]MCI6336654.1 lipoprotein signal peptidase [Prevotella sp.]MCI7088688.1 lipoprotein signal peptidase [Prevotella sp.]MCI7257564.1 lipoprotein signal peptidase [Prevotella sp.]MDD5784384.1 lipoprotein signal peptidase [Prevotella sp.]MDD6863853.1 lipoprotein signal peptidase [Prevotella sp.]